MMGELDVALGLLPTLLHDLRTTSPTNPQKRVEALRSHAFALTMRGREAEAMAALQEAVALATQAFGAQRPHPALMDVERGYADAVALAVLRQVLADLRALDVVQTQRVRTVMVTLGRALIAGGHLSEGVTLLTEAEAVHGRLTGGRNAEAVPTLRAQALALRRSGQLDAAHHAALAALEAACGPMCLALEHGLARVEAAHCALAAGGSQAAARAHLTEALAVWNAGQVDGPDVPAPVRAELAALNWPH